MKTLNEYTDTLPGGTHWSMLIRAGVQLRLTDIDGGGNVGMLMYNAENYLERLNVPDSLKCQHTFKLTAGHCLYSDMGRIFCSVIEDSCGWHDGASGTCNAQIVEAKWGEKRYQDHRNEFLRSGRDSFLIELAKYGMDRRDIVANMNWFSRVDVSADGDMALAEDSRPGQSVILRFEMDSLVIMHTCPHPLDQSESYPSGPIEYQLSLAEPVGDDDLCLNSREENRRGFANNAIYRMGM